ncbi:MAG: hypothetical protein KGH69_01050 [Candidatus Micrarchaeota archaeon]|nr:hypothetical protein [Candidatus Micrarchaeota archaeon]
MEKVSYREELKRAFGSRYDDITKSYDILGNIAIVEGTRTDARKKARIIMGINRNVRTVVRKMGAVSGKYRTRGYEYVAGEKSFVATYRENNCVFRFDIRKTFFSSRLSFERDRITRLSRDGERVIVMFAGMGPFAIELARKNRGSKIVAMELNRDSYRYMLDNIALNKVQNVVPELGDVKELVEKHRRFADRIIMPLPMESHKYLGAVNSAAAKGCVVHYYAFGDIDSPYKKPEEALKSFFAKKRRRFKVVGRRVVRPYSAMESEVVIDFELDGKRPRNVSK